MLQLRNINKSFDTKNVLDNFSYDFDDKGFYAIVGKTGRGKSTLLNILQLLEEYDEGSYYVDNTFVNSLNKKEKQTLRQQTFSFVSQDYNLFENITVLDNLKLAYLVKNQKIDLNKINAYLDDFDISELATKKVKLLCGGEKQRVAIIRCLLSESNYILCDEPTAALDVINSDYLFKKLKEISKDKCVIVVTHNRKLASGFCDKIIDLDNFVSNCNENITANTINTNFMTPKINVKNQIGIYNILFNKIHGFKIIYNIFISLFISLLSIFTTISFISEPMVNAYNLVENECVYTNVIKKNEHGICTITSDDINILTEKFDVLSYSKDLEDSIIFENENGNIFNTIYTELYSTEDSINKYGFTIFGKYPDATNEIAVSDYLINSIGDTSIYIDDGYKKVDSYEDILNKNIKFESGNEYFITGIIITGYKNNFSLNGEMDYSTKSEIETFYKSNCYTAIFHNQQSLNSDAEFNSIHIKFDTTYKKALDEINLLSCIENNGRYFISNQFSDNSRILVNSLKFGKTVIYIMGAFLVCLSILIYIKYLLDLKKYFLNSIGKLLLLGEEPITLFSTISVAAIIQSIFLIIGNLLIGILINKGLEIYLCNGFIFKLKMTPFNLIISTVVFTLLFLITIVIYWITLSKIQNNKILTTIKNNK